MRRQHGDFAVNASIVLTGRFPPEMLGPCVGRKENAGEAQTDCNDLRSDHLVIPCLKTLDGKWLW
jgi:hypothetical protein